MLIYSSLGNVTSCWNPSKEWVIYYSTTKWSIIQYIFTNTKVSVYEFLCNEFDLHFISHLSASYIVSLNLSTNIRILSKSAKIIFTTVPWDFWWKGSVHALCFTTSVALFIVLAHVNDSRVTCLHYIYIYNLYDKCVVTTIHLWYEKINERGKRRLNGGTVCSLQNT